MSGACPFCGSHYIQELPANYQILSQFLPRFKCLGCNAFYLFQGGEFKWIR